MSYPTFRDRLAALLTAPEPYSFVSSAAPFSDNDFNSNAFLMGFASCARCKWWEHGSHYMRSVVNPRPDSWFVYNGD